MAQEIDGFTIDMNRISRREFRAFMARLEAASDKPEERDILSGDLVEMVVTVWPFDGIPITREGYLDLGLEDGKRCDDAVTQAMDMLHQKK
jgi:hypothetical protein